MAKWGQSGAKVRQGFIGIQITRGMGHSSRFPHSTPTPHQYFVLLRTIYFTLQDYKHEMAENVNLRGLMRTCSKHIIKMNVHSGSRRDVNNLCEHHLTATDG